MDTEKIVGHKTDRYRIRQHIARGGMAAVYLAEGENLGRGVVDGSGLQMLTERGSYPSWVR